MGCGQAFCFGEFFVALFAAPDAFFLLGDGVGIPFGEVVQVALDEYIAAAVFVEPEVADGFFACGVSVPSTKPSKPRS